MFETRRLPNLSEDILTEFEHEIPELGESYTTPFTAIVFTLEGQFLGFGQVLGQVEDTEEVVIEIEDHLSPTRKVQILGVECLWNVSTPEIVDKYGEQEITSAYDYFMLRDKFIQSQNSN